MKLFDSVWKESATTAVPCPNCGETISDMRCNGCSYQDPAAVQRRFHQRRRIAKKAPLTFS